MPDNLDEDNKAAEPAEPAGSAAASETPKTGWWGRLKRKFSGQPAPESVPEAAPEAAPETAEAPAETPEPSELAPETAEAAEPPAETPEPSDTVPEVAAEAAEPPAETPEVTEGPQEPAEEPAETVPEVAAEPPLETSEAAGAAPEPPEAPIEPESARTAPEPPISDQTPPPTAPVLAEAPPEPSETAQEPFAEAPPEPPETAQEPSAEPPLAAGAPPEPPVPDQAPPEAAEAAPGEEAPDKETAEEAEAAGEVAKVGWFGRLKRKLTSTRDMLAGRLERALSAVRRIDEDVLEELEEIMISSDLGVKTTNDILVKIRGQVASKQLDDAAALKRAIKARIVEMVSLPLPPEPQVKPLVILMIGVNGVGKTTTIAKMARRYRSEGRKVLLAAGDTFRAAAVEQLSVWADRLGIDIVAQPTGADPSAVVFDSLSAAKARGVDVVLIDTAGRLHTKANLMEELKKIKRVAGKAMEGAPHQTVLVLDANTGQNAVSQAALFDEAIGVDRLVVTKLDGTSKGGVIVSIIHERRLPVAFIGLGETYEDLRPFEPEAFVEAILGAD